MNDEYKKCPFCHGTGFDKGKICSCITGKPEISKELRDFFGGIFDKEPEKETDG